jgi:hypothetical protein
VPLTHTRWRTRAAWALVLASAAGALGAIAWQQRAVTLPALPPGMVGSVDTPAAEAVVGDAIRVTGWALDPAGVSRVEIRVDGHRYPARYGLARPDVAEVKPGYPDSRNSGFEFESALPPADPVRRELDIVAVNRAGAEKLLARKALIAPAALAQWQALYDERSGRTAPPFYILPATSGITVGGAAELETVYAAYGSPTVQFGVRVPILYLRTTKGVAGDWVFDPDFDVDRRCGERRIADDALSVVIAHAIAKRLPVLFTLNGGVWADASCDVPQWDVNDHLERDAANCQWNERNEVMADDYLKNLPGSTKAPELARSLTFNVYAAKNRYYKRRNLQAAGRVIAAFAREHPALFVGVNLDPDTYHNPFFEERQWYDYNPGTLRQFRHWLAGSGPYAGKSDGSLLDLSPYRRARPLTLTQVRALAGRPFRSWDEVDPPRIFPRTGTTYWEDAWTHEWEVFRRHLVDLHYDELSQWLADAGIPSSRIFSSQGFMAPNSAEMPFAVRLESPTKNHDSGGMSVEGSVPRAGHLGAIVYGASAVNESRMETQRSLFAEFHRIDPAWGVVEFNTADLRAPEALPTYAMGYRALREMWNYGARFASPMAWNGSNGIYAGQAGYVSYMAWRNTPLENAMRDFAVSHAFVPLGSRLWTFGSPRHADADGWTATEGGISAGTGYLQVDATAKEIALLSPSQLAVGRGETDLLVLGVDAKAVKRVRVDARAADGAWIALAPSRATDELATTAAGVSVPLSWPSAFVAADQVRVVLELTDASKATRVRHIALYRAAS